MGAELIAATDWNAVAATAINVLKVAAGLGFVIFVHELGHFVVAKLCGVKCEKFYVGFDIPMPFGIPSKLYRIQWGETEYGIGILPLGGYVKMLGQDDNPLNAEKEAERTRLQNEAAASGAAAPTTAANTTVPPASTTPSQTAPAAAMQKAAIDPRSYTAKTVPQRMAIISAGVIVNLIFAVIFATVAYRIGVSITPCEIGQVVPGGPAWEAGLEPNTRIVQIGVDSKKSDKLRFDWDLRQGVGLHGDQADLPLTVRDEQGNESVVHVRPVTFSRGWEKMSSIGITAERTLELKGPPKAPPAFPGSSAFKASPALQSEDRVVAVDGQPVASQHEFMAYMAQHPDKPVTLRVERAARGEKSVAEEVDVVVAPQRRRSIGVVMQHGPIMAIRPNSPAAAAGFQEGDVITAIDGKPLGDPMMLPAEIKPFHGREVEVTVDRAGKSVNLTVTPVQPKTFDWDWAGMPRAPMSSEALGVAFDVQSVVKSVEPGSQAEQQGLKVGDKLVAVQVQWKNESESSKRDATELTTGGEEIRIENDFITWPVVTEYLQHIDDDEIVVLTYERGNTLGKVRVSPSETDVYQPDRGFIFANYSETHIASTFGEAFSLGLRQTWEDATRVVGLLRKLVTGSVSVTNLGGIGSIAYVASSEASEGMTRLLIFLTMLSANLAVLNFLPIPALDGGHMMFLMYEGLFRKPVSERVQVALTIFGVVCLLGLMIFVNAMDVKRFFF